ncbi:MAG: ABC transporter ATP-binding protein [Pseudomonadota bacterium]
MNNESNSENTPSRLELSRLLVDLWRHITKRRKWQLLLLLILMLVSAFSEVISLGAILPFIGVLTAPDRVFNQPGVRELVQIFGITEPNQLVFPLALVFATAALFAGVIRLLLLWVSTRLAFAIGTELSREVYRRMLYQPYQFHVARNSSELISVLTSKTQNSVSVLVFLLTLASSTVLLVSIVMALMAIDPLVVASAAAGLGLSYAVITLWTRRELIANSEQVARESDNIVQALQEGLGGIRDVLLNGTQPVYCAIFNRSDWLLRRSQGNIYITSYSPRPAMEAIGMVLIAGLAYALSRQTGELGATLPVLGALALGTQRLLPALQTIYNSWVSIVGYQASLFDVIDLLNQPLPDDALSPAPPPLQFKDTIRFESVRFRYLDQGPWVINDINLTISKGSRVGFVGGTGGGKSTTIDLLMGLLKPTEGRILVDGLPISGERLRAWKRAIAHVPQSIFLADTTMAENIALGIPKTDINMEKVKQAARQAQIANFIESQAEGYDAFVGERGIRLSGGQRQRIGIARALYKDASVLVFDEATSSLDNQTEQAVMNSIEGLHRDLTILIIAHRLTTIQRCDMIVELVNGWVVAQGTYEELLERSPSFRKMASISD